MEINIWKKPKNPIIIEGFPGFGLVGTIATEFLLDHLKFEQIGKIMFYELPAMVAIHENNIVEPLGLFYNKEYNLVVLHAVTASAGFEWKIADTLIKISKQLNSKEIICLEGVGSGSEVQEPNAFYYSNNGKKSEKLKSLGLKPLNEGIIMGVTGALFLKSDKDVTALFADTHSEIPDSLAAAKIIEALDKYLGLKVEIKPLLAQAKKFEEKLRGLLTQSQKAQEISEQKKLSYVG